MSTTPVLSIENLSIALPKSGDRALAVNNVSFTVGAGEIVCVVGESGSGKSVTAHSIMGLLPKGQLTPVSGSIKLEGREVLGLDSTSLRALRGRRMAMIFQEPMTALNPVVTVGEQIAEVLKIHTDLDANQRRDKVVAMMGDVHLPNPAELYDRYPHQVLRWPASADHDRAGADP